MATPALRRWLAMTRGGRGSHRRREPAFLAAEPGGSAAASAAAFRFAGAGAFVIFAFDRAVFPLMAVFVRFPAAAAVAAVVAGVGVAYVLRQEAEFAAHMEAAVAQLFLIGEGGCVAAEIVASFHEAAAGG